MTSNCPHGKCDGSGIMWLRNTETFETKAQYCTCREQKLHNKRLDFANIPKEFSALTIKSFDSEIYERKEDIMRARIAKKQAVKFVNCFEEDFEPIGKGIYLYNSTKGSGKTRLAVSVGNAILNAKHKQVKFITALDILKEIKNTYNRESKYTESQLIESINGVQVLIVDDIGVEQPTPWVNEILYSIFDTRMKYNKVTIFTSNCSMEDLKHDGRLKSRIFKMAMPIEMPEEDIRIKLSKIQNRELQDLLLAE